MASSRTAIGLAALSLLALGACDRKSPSTPFPPFAAASSAVSDLNIQELDQTTETATQGTGELDRGADTFAFNARSGTINAARTLVTLNGAGGTIDLTGTGDYARFFIAQPTGGTGTRGVIGIPTPAANMPGSGTSTYSGTTVVTIQDNLTVYDLSGTVTATADFIGGTLDVTLDDLSGTQTFIGTSNVTNVATVALTGATIAGNTASGGTPTLTSATINGGNDFSAAAVIQHQAGFYGPRADEVGGVLFIRDGAQLSVSGEYLGD